MTRRKVRDEDKLTHKVTIRLSDPDYTSMEKMRVESNCQSMAEFLRLIILKKEIIWYHKDATWESTALELAGIRKELYAISLNIGAALRHITAAAPAQKKAYEALRILDQFQKVGKKVDQLFPLIANLSEKWLPESPPEKT